MKSILVTEDTWAALAQRKVALRVRSMESVLIDLLTRTSPHAPQEAQETEVQ